MLLVNIFGLLLIGLIVWWFWIFKPQVATSPTGGTVIKVENGTYEPSRISLPSGAHATLRFLRLDESPCSSVVMFADLDISEELPIGEIKEVEIPALPSGDYPFTCQMQMYRGELVVQESSLQ